MTKKKPIPTDTRLEIRLDPYVADQLKDAAKETGISLNQLMKSICIWTTANLNIGKPVAIHNSIIQNESSDGMLWLGQTEKGDGCDGDVYAVFDFSTQRAVRHPREFFHSEENPYD